MKIVSASECILCVPGTHRQYAKDPAAARKLNTKKNVNRRRYPETQEPLALGKRRHEDIENEGKK